MLLIRLLSSLFVFVLASPAYAAGQIPFTINLSEAVTVTGAPRIRMDVGGATRYATYTSGSGTAALVFTYQMVSGDVDANGVQLFSPIQLNGGTIKDAAGNNAALAFAVPNTSGINVNAAVPSGYTVAITPASITPSNQTAFAFDLDYNKTNRTYSYSIASSGGGTPITSTGTTTGALQTLSGIDVTSLPDGTLTLSLTLTDSLGGVGVAATDTVTKTNILLGLTACPSGNLAVPANVACARLFGADPTNLADVGVFAGELPDSTEVFVKRCDQGMTWDGSACAGARSTIQWKNANTESDTDYVVSGGAITQAGAVDGPTNTTLLTDNEAPGTHPAAESCRNMGANWYLPAITELDIVYSNLKEGEHLANDDTDNPRPTISGGNASSGNADGPLVTSFDTSLYYWSSSELSNTSLYVVRFGDGYQNTFVKNNVRPLRCARRN